MKSVFETLSAINCNGHTEKKNGLTYLSWAWAWAELKKAYPESYYTIYENRDGWNYFTDGRTCWVKTGVTVVWYSENDDCHTERHELELIEDLPVMDFRNASIPVEKVTSFDVNKAIQRSLTKACARHGLGLYIYAGEDLPEEACSTPQTASAPVGKEETRTAKTTTQTATKDAGAQKAKAKLAWGIFTQLKTVQSMDVNARSKFFFTTLRQKVGKEDPRELTVAEWDKVITELSAIKEA